MNVLYSVAGNQHYIADMGSGEIAVFDSFGKNLGMNGSISSLRSTIKVDVLSIVDRGNKRQCEMMYKDRKITVDERLFNCVASIRQLGGYLGTMFYIQHKDESGSYTQVIFLYNQGALAEDTVYNKIKDNIIGKWENL